jgi:hypothetical protein
VDIPPYVDMTDAEEETYQQDFNQTLRDGLSNNGWTVPQLTTAQLTTEQVQNPADGALTTLNVLMPDGTLWFVTDATPPCYVGKISGSLVKFTTTAFP